MEVVGRHLGVVRVDQPEGTVGFVVVNLPEQDKARARRPAQQSLDISAAVLLLRGVVQRAPAILADPETRARDDARLVRRQHGLHVIQRGPQGRSAGVHHVVSRVGETVQVRYKRHHAVDGALVDVGVAGGRVQHAIHLGIIKDVDIAMQSGAPGIVHRLLPVVQPIDHALDRRRRWVGRGIVVRQQIPIPFPVPEIESLARVIVMGEQIASEVVHLPVIVRALADRIAVKGPGVSKWVGPHDEMLERHAEHMMIRGFVTDERQQIRDIRPEIDPGLPGNLRAEVKLDDAAPHRANGLCGFDEQRVRCKLV